jgi:putative transposase
MFQTKEGLMPSYQTNKSFPQRFGVVLSSFMQHPGLPFADVLPEEKIEQAFDDENRTFAQDDDAVYTPALTMWAFLSQVLFKQEHRSCLAAVARVVVLCVSLGRKPPSDNSGAYCRARYKLPVGVVRRLALSLAQGCEQRVPEGWLWRRRHVTLADGSCSSMPDTPENQAAFPQPTSQKPGLGFPLARLVTLLSLATGMLMGMELGPYAGKETGETALLRQLLDCLQPGAVVLGDRYFCSYFMIALLLEVGVDVVTRLHQRRSADFRRGQRLGKNDHLVVWLRPVKPDWMDQETYERMPTTLTVREVHVEVNEPGFRVDSLVVVTTLTDAVEYTSEDLAELYHQRWLVELDIRAIKTSLGMDVLRCKTPEMVVKEIWIHLLAYNLIRQSMLQAALAKKLSPRQLSFTAALQKIGASWMVLAVANETILVTLVAVNLKHLATHQIGKRPGRVEPRAVKRRPKPHPLLTKPRAEARAELLRSDSR